MKDSEFKYKLVVAVRRDLKLSPGKLAVQVAHAAVSCAITAKRKKRIWFKEWIREGQKKVVVKVPSKEDLFLIKDRAELRGLTTNIIQDAGLTEIPPGTVTCMGIGPGPSAEVDRITGSLPLL